MTTTAPPPALLNSSPIITGRSTYRRDERLKSRKLINKLFSEGTTITCYPIRILYTPTEEATTHQVLFSAPKRNLKHAVDRNKIKRKMREAYRLRKYLLRKLPNTHFLLGYVYIAHQATTPFHKIEDAIIRSIQQINQAHNTYHHDYST